VSECCQYEYNSVLLNLYHDGSEGMGWHSDDEKELGQSPTIASLSFGAIRRCEVRHKRSGKTITQSLEPGGLIVMSGQSQACWRHQVPKQLRVKEPRINLTFRYFNG
jgi:alkylated DNA repair dioxygenase AlkB